LYQLNAGSSPGATNYYDSGHITGTSAVATNLPVDGSTVYVQLWSYINGVWSYNSYTYIAFKPVPATISSPTAGATLTGTSVTFNWTAGTGVTMYQLNAGSSVGANNYYNSGHVTGTSAVATNLPVDGSTVYVQLWSYINGVWSYNSYTFTAANFKAILSSPAPSSTLTGSSVTFSWTTGTNVAQYDLYVGSTQGGSQYLNTGDVTTTSATASNLPINGSTVWVRLNSQINGTWYYTDYSYTALTAAPATISSPTAGSTLNGTAVTFNWTAGSGVTMYQLNAGSSAGATNYYNSGHITGTSAVATNLPVDGSTVYVQLWSYINGVWSYNSYTYTAQ